MLMTFVVVVVVLAVAAVVVGLAIFAAAVGIQLRLSGPDDPIEHPTRVEAIRGIVRGGRQ